MALDLPGDSVPLYLNGGFVVIDRFDSLGVVAKINAVHSPDTQSRTWWGWTARFHALETPCPKK